MKYYFSELQNFNSFRKAESIEAKNLKGAKISARKNQYFQNTFLEIGTEIDENGFINTDSLLAYTDMDGEWIDVL